jgi:cation diffusion facilitator family transporter
VCGRWHDIFRRAAGAAERRGRYSAREARGNEFRDSAQNKFELIQEYPTWKFYTPKAYINFYIEQYVARSCFPRGLRETLRVLCRPQKMDKSEQKSKILLFVEIGGDFLSSAAKFIIGVLANSSAMIAEGFHSLADTANQFFLLIGITTSKKPADEEHPFGYGKERFFWAFLSALFILVISGGFSIYQGINKIMKPEPITSFDLSFLVLGIALVFQFFTLFMSSRYYRFLVGKTGGLKESFLKIKFVKEPTAINLWLGDWLAVVGNMLAGIALFFVWLTGNVVYDGVASIMIGIMLVFLGLFLVNDTKKLLIGEAVTPAMYEKIVEIIRSCPEVRGIVKLKTMHLTPNEILINADIDFKYDLDTREIEKAIDRIEHLIKSQIPAAKQISIEVESRK